MANRGYRRDLSPAPKRHTDPDKFIIYVLWLIGHSERSISAVMGFRTKQISGIIGKSEYKNRSSMTDQERKRLLSELEDIRFEDGFPIDGGRLNKIRWELIPLGGAQLRGPLKRKIR